MKTVGQIISQARKEQQISIEKLSQITKIDPDYLKALEKDEYELLPSHTFIKGFIRNVAQALGKKPDDLVAVFRRDFSLSSSVKLTPDKNLLSRQSMKKKFQSTSLIFVLGIFIFLIYLVFQLRAFIIPPKLEIYQPKAEAVLTSPLTVEGVTSPDSIIQINQDLIVKPDNSGYFITSIPFSLGENQIEISATNRFGRINNKRIPITLVSQ